MNVGVAGGCEGGAADSGAGEKLAAAFRAEVVGAEGAERAFDEPNREQNAVFLSFWVMPRIV